MAQFICVVTPVSVANFLPPAGWPLWSRFAGFQSKWKASVFSYFSVMFQRHACQRDTLPSCVNTQLQCIVPMAVLCNVNIDVKLTRTAWLLTLTYFSDVWTTLHSVVYPLSTSGRVKHVKGLSCCCLIIFKWWYVLTLYLTYHFDVC